MSATRRKGSRGGRSGSRAGGPPASNALTWAESLAAGEVAPTPSALEWAEGLNAGDSAPPNPWGAASAAPGAGPAGGPQADSVPDVAGDPAAGGGASPWGSVPTGPTAGSEGDAEANPWGSVAAATPAPPRGRGRGKAAGGKPGKPSKSSKAGKVGKAGKGRSKDKGRKGAADLTPTPPGGFPLGAASSEASAGTPPLPHETAADAPDLFGAGPGGTTPEPGGTEPPGAEPGTSEPGDVARDGSASEPGGRQKASRSSRTSTRSKSPTGSKGPKGRVPTPSTAQQKQIKRTLRRGLPKMFDKPMVLVLAGVIAAVLGLGTGWGTSLLQGGGALPMADAASCAQTQMAWTQAANAQSAMVEDQPDTLRKGFINARNALDGVTPPEGIADDWAVAYTYFSTVANNIEKVKSNDGPAVISAVGGAQEQLDTEAMVEASESISTYVNSNCNQ